MPPVLVVQRQYQVDTLEEQTQSYWELCQKYHRNTLPPLTVGDAIQTLREILQNVGPHRIVSKLAYDMQVIIVNGGSND